jgi:hypothetical protein
VIDTLTGTNWELAEPRLVLLLSLAVRLVIIHSNWYGQSCNAIEVAPSKWAEPSCETVYRATSARASKPSGAINRCSHLKVKLVSLRLINLLKLKQEITHRI